MSEYQANIITRNPATPGGPSPLGAAPGVWRLNDVAGWIKQGVWPDTNVDPYWAYLSLLLSTTSLNNANNNLFVDSSGAFNPVSRNGNTTQGSFTPYSTNWSNYFDGSGDYLQIPNNAALGVPTGDFTFETWVYPTALTGQNYTPIAIYAINNVSVASDLGYACIIKSNNTVEFAVYVGSTAYRATSTSTISANTWTHVAGVRSGNTLTLYLNGTSAATVTISGTINDSTNPVYRIGGYQETSTFYYFTGYISNQRLVKGTAVYTNNFTPPAAPLTAISGTSLLTCQSNRFRDASSNNFAMTVTGNTAVQEFNPFILYPSAIAYNQSDITNWSGYFDGTGDYGRITGSQTALQFGTGDFTLEGWVYSTGATGTYQQILTGGTSWTSGSGGVYWYYNSGSPYIGAAWNQIATNPAVNSSTLAINTWHHFAVVRSGNTLSLYVNGTSVDTLDVTGVSIAVNNQSQTNIGGGGWDQDFGGYLSNLRVVKGTAVYTSNFTPPTTNLTAISGTSLLTLQNAAFTDNSTNNFVITPTGNVTVTGNSPFNPVGYWSNSFIRSPNSYLTVPNPSGQFSFGTGDFTIEAWVYLNSMPSADGYSASYWIVGGGPVSSNPGFDIAIGLTNLQVGLANFSSLNINAAHGMVANKWYHVAIVRSGSTLYAFINGSQLTTASVSGVTADPNITGLAISAAEPTGATAGNFNGYISNLRIVKGTAVYTSAFTVPTTPLTAISGTQLLTCQNGRFVDNSTNNFTITVNGTSKVQSFNPLYAPTIASNGGSIYLDGNGDWVQAQSPNMSGSWTAEIWWYPVTFSASTGQSLITFNDGSYPGINIWCNTSGQLVVDDGATGQTAFSTTTFKLNQWNHVAVVRNGTTTTGYINGSVAGSNTFTPLTTSTVLLGRYNQSSLNLYLTGWLADARITNGIALYTSAFTPPTTPLSPTSATNLLVNGMNAGVYDASGSNNMETVGNAQVRFPTPFAPATYYAGAFDGSGDYLTVPYSTALQLPSDFTIETWVYLNSRVTSFPCIVSNYSAYTVNGGFALFAGHSFNTTKYTVSFNGSFPVLTSTSDIAYGVWTHLAVVRSGSTLTLYVNGVSEATATNSATVTGTGDNWWIATAGDSVASGYINGSISNLRVVKGTAVYTSNFTPSTTPLTAISGTALLTCQNKTFIDNSANAIAITSYGNATAGAIGPFTATGGTSVYFDGSGDYLSTPSNPAYALSGTSFTIEAWVYVTSSSEPYQAVVKAVGSGSNNLMFIDYSGGSTGVLSSQSGGTVATRSGVTLNTWHHLAVVRNGTSVTCYVNGVGGTPQTIDPGSSGSVSLLVGYDGGTSPARYFNGYMDDLRVTRGVARYTANFTPPTAPFPTY